MGWRSLVSWQSLSMLYCKITIDCQNAIGYTFCDIQKFEGIMDFTSSVSNMKIFFWFKCHPLKLCTYLWKSLGARLNLKRLFRYIITRNESYWVPTRYDIRQVFKLDILECIFRSEFETYSRREENVLDFSSELDWQYRTTSVKSFRSCLLNHSFFITSI